MKVAVAAAIFSCVTVNGQAWAAPGQAQMGQIPPAGVCAAKEIQDAKGGTKPFLAIALSADVAQLLSAGFATAPCGDALQHLAEYKANVCKIADFGNDAVQGRFEQVLGVAPAKLCRFAKSLLG